MTTGAGIETLWMWNKIGRRLAAAYGKVNIITKIYRK
jgi:hypothetical protein